MKSFYHKRLIDESKKLYLLLLLIIASPFLWGQIPVPKFSIEDNSPCDNHIQFINESQNATNYLWAITKGLQTIIETPTENPLIAIGNLTEPTPFHITLKAMNLVSGIERTMDSTITFLPRPFLNLTIEGADMVCSNEKETIFYVEEIDQYQYNWSAKQQGNFTLVDTTTSTNALMINWGTNTGSQPLEIEISCKIISPYGCVNTLTHNLLFLPTTVPADAKLYWKSDMRTLLCVFDNPTLEGNQVFKQYSYSWGYYNNNEPEKEYYFESNPEQAYFQFPDGVYNPVQNTYFVEIVSKEFPLCTLRVEGVTEEELFKDTPDNRIIEVNKIYPNPLNGNGTLMADILNKTHSDQEINISIFNMIGKRQYFDVFLITREMNNLSVPLPNLKNGNYIIHFQTTNSQRVVKKFVVFNK